ncbi:uncharacterized protein LOC134191228 [Corticium candelabrum]|uniref:uncharacterized protein LOC134191228 n=1 Tax=Corticium candelabrum TaxID=121492 RepID=UPI002E25358B|nr:uncharacterized protein LOC134191228 [Corticium candelabrum]
MTSYIVHTCLLLSLFATRSESHLIKIALPTIPEQTVRGARHIARRETEACTNYVEVSINSLTIPTGFENIMAPWTNNNLNVKAYRSSTVSQGIDQILRLKVPGLGGSTVGDVFQHLKDNGPCWILPYGGVVRDIFLGRPPNDVDAEISCPASHVRTLCLQKWGSSNCQGTSDSSITYIGSQTAKVSTGDTQGIDLAPWDLMIRGSITSFEYTANSLAYDMSGNNVVLDFTSTGVMDTCQKKIRIPSFTVNDWVTDKKVYRYWKLRVKGFSADSSETANFIVTKAKDFISKDGQPFAKFYCSYVLMGTYSTDGGTCSIADSSSVAANVKKYGQFFLEDMGSFWTETAQPIANGIKQVPNSALDFNTKVSMASVFLALGLNSLAVFIVSYY